MQTTNIISEPLVAWGVAARPLPGQAVSGDLHLVKSFSSGVLIAVLDGIGHGAEAAAAAWIGAAVLENHAGEPPVSLVKHCHTALAKTRGVVLTLASVDPLAGTLAWLGVGSVEARLLRADPQARSGERVVLRGGVVGYQLPELRVNTLFISAGDLLVFATDGVDPGLAQDWWAKNDSPEQIANRIMERHFKGTDDALVLVVRYLGLS